MQHQLIINFQEEEIYEINLALCTKCVGHFNEPQCQIVCPVAGIILDPQFKETPASLKIKYPQLTGLSEQK